MNVSPKASEEVRYARKVCFFIGLFGLFILFFVNMNFYLLFSGIKYEAKVVQIEKLGNKYQIDLEYELADASISSLRIYDYTGEDFLFFIEEGDILNVYKSRDYPNMHYVPRPPYIINSFIIFFFILVPFIFMIFGRIKPNI